MRASFVSLALVLFPILAEPIAVANSTSFSWVPPANASTGSNPSRELTAFDCTMAHNLGIIGTSYRQFRANQSSKCCHDCKDSSGKCKAYMWTNTDGGTCYFYADRSQLVYTIVVGADTCLLNEAGGLFPFFDCDLPGNDLSSQRLESEFLCPDECNQLQGCKAFTWTDYEGGTCWFKRDIPMCVYKQGAVSVVIQNQLASYYDGEHLP